MSKAVTAWWVSTAAAARWPTEMVQGSHGQGVSVVLAEINQTAELGERAVLVIAAFWRAFWQCLLKVQMCFPRTRPLPLWELTP